jgi:hypothetical protein
VIADPRISRIRCAAPMAFATVPANRSTARAPRRSAIAAFWWVLAGSACEGGEATASADSSTSGAASTDDATLGSLTHATSAEATSAPMTASAGTTEDPSTTIADSGTTIGTGTSGTASDTTTGFDTTSVDSGSTTGGSTDSGGSTSAQTAEATTSTTGSGATSSSTTEALGSESSTTVDLDVAPAPGRWVLRDADGVATNAVATPACGGTEHDCVIPDFGTQGPIYPQCAHVTWIGAQYVNAPFTLATGRFEDCAPHAAAPVHAFGWELDDECVGPFYTYPGFGTVDAQAYVRALRVLDSDGVTYYEDAAIPPFVPDGYYSMTVFGEECIHQDNSHDYAFATWSAAPAWMLDAFANPPYSMSWET